MYKKGNFILHSDFEIREIRPEDENGDIDIFIPIDYRTLNLIMPFIDSENMSRIQLSEVKSIVMRFNTSDENNLCSIHFLKNIDLLSHILNFDFNYALHEIYIKNEEYNASFNMLKR